jgi:hypothetical protein
VVTPRLWASRNAASVSAVLPRYTRKQLPEDALCRPPRWLVVEIALYVFVELIEVYYFIIFIK